MQLPQELIDKIINHLDTNDKQSLRNCSLVATSWTHTSRKRLFRSVEIPSCKLQSWQNNISPENELLQHTRVLCYHESDKGCNGKAMPVHETFHDYLRSFCKLEHFTLYSSGILLSPQQIESFSAFQITLSGITLQNCSGTEDGLVTLINYFPNLTHLNIYGLWCSPREGPTPPLSQHVHLKKLDIAKWHGDHRFILPKPLGLRCDEISFTNPTPAVASTSFVQDLVSNFGVHTKRLRLHRTRSGTCSLSCSCGEDSCSQSSHR